jgi:RNA polymerase sigma factor (sigma-70 family)
MELPTDTAIPTRYSLLSRLQDWQDQESWQVFFDTYWRLIYAVALRSGLTETEAQEVLQETVICVARDIGKFKRDRSLGSFKGWLRNITRWRIADQLRKRTRGRSDTSVPAAEEIQAPVNGSEADAVWDLEWKENLLQAAIERVKHRVNPEHFQIFDLYALRQWPVHKVAQTLGVSVPRVYLAKHRVAALIKKEIKAMEKGRRLGGLL